ADTEGARLPDGLGGRAAPGAAGGRRVTATAPGATLRIAFLASRAEGAQRALEAMAARHGQHAPEDADVLVALGGDGFMLQVLHRHAALGRPVFGMKLGGVGFLMNHYRDDATSPEAMASRINAAEPAVLRPLEMLALTESGASTGSLAYNEVSLLRQTRQAAHLAVDLN